MKMRKYLEPPSEGCVNGPHKLECNNFFFELLGECQLVVWNYDKSSPSHIHHKS
jgi:hypothetical protein